MKGRKPKLAIVASNPQPLRRAPPAPEWFGEYARAEWRRAAPYMRNAGLLNPETVLTFENYCVAAGQVREAEERMLADGRTVEGKDHPAFKMQVTAMREARLLACELGLTPLRRAAKGGDAPKVDGWADDLLA